YRVCGELPGRNAVAGPVRRASVPAAGRARGPAMLQIEECLLTLGVERIALDGQPEPGPRLLVPPDSRAGQAELMRQLGVVLPFGGRGTSDQVPEIFVPVCSLEVRPGRIELTGRAQGRTQPRERHVVERVGGQCDAEVTNRCGAIVAAQGQLAAETSELG